MVTKEIIESYWRENKALMYLIMLIWFIVSYVAAVFASALNNISIIGFPLGYYMGAQGSIVTFVVLNYYYSMKMNQLDQKYGLQED
jgi:putative solute:sodium symporter small subunit